MSKVYRQWPVVLPPDDQFGGAVDAINNLTQNGLFVGQSPEFLRTLTLMAEDADAAVPNRSSLRPGRFYAPVGVSSREWSLTVALAYRPARLDSSDGISLNVPLAENNLNGR
jgi:hypothetical protein